MAYQRPHSVQKSRLQPLLARLAAVVRMTDELQGQRVGLNDRFTTFVRGSQPIASREGESTHLPRLVRSSKSITDSILALDGILMQSACNSTETQDRSVARASHLRWTGSAWSGRGWDSSVASISEAGDNMHQVVAGTVKYKGSLVRLQFIITPSSHHFNTNLRQPITSHIDLQDEVRS